MRKLGKSCVLLECFYFFEIINHGGRWGNMAQALTQWRHLVASHEATDALHWAMHPISHRCIRMAIEIASVSHVFFVIVDFIVCHNQKLKTMLWL
jgi:hypothetical protein